MSTSLSFEECLELLRLLDRGESGDLKAIAAARQAFEDSRVAGKITLHQWRILLEEACVLQARIARADANAWRTPPVVGSERCFVPPCPTILKR